MRSLTPPLLASLALVVIGCGEPDKDNDGFVASADCNDNDASINEEAEELCDGVDNNCDGLTDDDESIVDGTTWFLDRDIDGFGDDDVTTTSCAQPLGTWAIEGGDCDDTDPSALPGGQEVCNGKDDDCDGSADEAEDAEGTVRVYEDFDFDSFGNPETGIDLCPEQVPTLWVDNGDDCNDEDKGVYPGAPEYCNEQDDDCDSSTDELNEVVDGFDAWVDDDGDGYGQPGTDQYVCVLPDGYADQPGDCNDDDDVVALGCGCTTPAAEDLTVSGTVTLEGGEHQFGTLYVPSGATLRFTGNLPAYVFAESIVVEGTIDGAAKGTEPGPGAVPAARPATAPRTAERVATPPSAVVAAARPARSTTTPAAVVAAAMPTTAVPARAGPTRRVASAACASATRSSPSSSRAAAVGPAVTPTAVAVAAAAAPSSSWQEPSTSPA